MKTDEDDEFERIEREQSMVGEKRKAKSLKTNQESFDDWEHSHRPDRYWIENRAYIAGFNAGERNERMKKELND